MSFHVLSLYMHEIVTHGECAEDCRMDPSGTPLIATDTPLTPAHINALSACLTAIDGIFDVFLSLDVHTIRCLPVFNFVRVAYAVVVLIKLYFAASSPKSELGKVINKANMKVEQHLDNLLEKFRATAAEDRSRPAIKFLVVLFMLRSWFEKQKQSQSSGLNAAAFPSAETPPPAASYSARQSTGEKGTPTPSAPTRPHHHQQQQPQPQPQQPNYTTTTSTPLQLLSEIATNNSAASTTLAPRTAAPRPTSSADLLQGNSSPPWLNRPLMYGGALHQQPGTTSTGADRSPPAFIGGIAPPQQSMASSSLPWLNSPLHLAGGYLDGAMLGDGFAQAMDLTLGGVVDGSFSAEDSLRYMDAMDLGWFQMGGGGGVVGMDAGGFVGGAAAGHGAGVAEDVGHGTNGFGFQG
jgi:hypothetical protein